MIWLSSISGVQPGERMVWVTTVIFDMSNEMSVLVCDLYVAKMVGDGPVSNDQISAQI